MAKREIFNCGNLNTNGVCHAICGEWIKKSRYHISIGNDIGVSDVGDLGTRSFLMKLWDEANGFVGIEKNNLLAKSKDVYSFEPKGYMARISPEIIKREILLTKWDKFSLLSLWGRNGEGHSLATRVSNGNPRRFQFLDPNAACWEYDSKLELATDVVNRLVGTYQNLLFEVRLYRVPTRSGISAFM